jgi:hypothetical protein
MDYLQNDPDYEKYMECKRFVKEFERKISQRKLTELPMWRKPDLKMTCAASILSRLKREMTKPDRDEHLCDKFREFGKRKYDEVMVMVEHLSEDDKKLFWESQVRNKNVTCFEELITKKEYDSLLKNKD